MQNYKYTHIVQHFIDSKTGKVYAHLKDIKKDLGYYKHDFDCDFSDEFAQATNNSSDILINNFLSKYTAEEIDYMEHNDLFPQSYSKLLNLEEGIDSSTQSSILIEDTGRSSFRLDSDDTLLLMLLVELAKDCINNGLVDNLDKSNVPFDFIKDLESRLLQNADFIRNTLGKSLKAFEDFQIQ